MKRKGGGTLLDIGEERGRAPFRIICLLSKSSFPDRFIPPFPRVFSFVQVHLHVSLLVPPEIRFSTVFSIETSLERVFIQIL